MRLVVYAGAVWTHCSPTEVERIDFSSVDEAVDWLAEWLSWLPRAEAERVAREVVETGDYVLAGYSNDLLGLVAYPPEGAEPCDTSRLGDTVYVVPGEPDGDLSDVPGQAWEPFYVFVSFSGEDEA